jgi:formate dehydrogenase major subunit
MVYWGHAPNSQTRGKDMVEAMKKLDLMVVIDPYPSATRRCARWCARTACTCCRRARSSRRPGSVTASGRSIQWREKVIEPLFESKPDHTLMVRFADKFGFKNELVKNFEMKKDKDGWDEPTPESILKEINRCTWTIGYTGQSPERLKLHMQNMATFDIKTLRAAAGRATAITSACRGRATATPRSSIRARPTCTRPRAT